jgi:hypothetical protein
MRQHSTSVDSLHSVSIAISGFPEIVKNILHGNFAVSAINEDHCARCMYYEMHRLHTSNSATLCESLVEDHKRCV